MLHIALAFLLGNCVVQLAPELISVVPAAAALAMLPLLWTRLSRAAILAFLLGIVWVIFSASMRLSDDLDPDLEGVDVGVRGYVASIPEIEAYGVRFLFEVEQGAEAVETTETGSRRLPLQSVDGGEGALRSRGAPPRIELTWYDDQAEIKPANAQIKLGETRIKPIGLQIKPAEARIKPGELWELTVRLKRRRGFANPGGFDYEAQLFREGIGATGYVRQDENNRRLAEPSPRYAILRLRARLIDFIVAALPVSPMQGVVRGLVVGDQQAIDAAQWSVFARTGTSHLVAISGLHIGMVAMLAAWFGGLAVRCKPAQARRWSRVDARAMCGLVAGLAYSLLAGMSIPTQRTCVMLSVYFGALLLRRRIGVWHSFGLALLWVLLIDPFAPLAVGFWLSFGAVVAILLTVSGRLATERWFTQYLRVQGVVTLGLIPVLLFAFGNLSFIAPLVNLFAIPAFTLLIVPPALVGTLLSVCYAPLGAVILTASAEVLEWTYSALQWCASWPAATGYFAQAPIWALTMAGAGVLAISAPLISPLRMVGALLCLPALLWQQPRLPAGVFSLAMLDVGQGLALVIQTRDHVLLYDAGPAFRSGRNTGEMVLLPYLRARGVRRLDAVVASHGDADHVGGLQTVLSEMPAAWRLLGPSVPSIPGAHACRYGQHWTWDEVKFRVLHPAGSGSDDSDNNSSCVLRVESPGGSALLTGDIEYPVEQYLLGLRRIEPATIVVAAHHGSRSSSSAEFIAATQARFVLFSAGYRNRWGLPKSDVRERWARSGAAEYSTIASGAVELTVAPDGAVTVAEYRRSRRRYWQSE